MLVPSSDRNFKNGPGDLPEEKPYLQLGILSEESDTLQHLQSLSVIICAMNLSGRRGETWLCEQLKDVSVEKLARAASPPPLFTKGVCDGLPDFRLQTLKTCVGRAIF